MVGWIEPGAHINAMGADSPGKQELDPRILTYGHIIVDHKSQARIYGEIHRPLQQQLLSETAVAGDIGEVVAGRYPAGSQIRKSLCSTAPAWPWKMRRWFIGPIIWPASRDWGRLLTFTDSSMANPEKAAIIYGLVSAASWGSGDFTGGFATKSSSVAGVLLVGSIVGVVLLIPDKSEPNPISVHPFGFCKFHQGC
jgi:hypothetical protein